MQNDAKLVIGFISGLATTAASTAAPQAFPSLPTVVWQLLFWGGGAVAAFCIVLIVYDHAIRPHLSGNGKMLPLAIMAVCGVGFLASSAWFILDRTKSSPAAPQKAEKLTLPDAKAADTSELERTPAASPASTSQARHQPPRQQPTARQEPQQRVDILAGSVSVVVYQRRVAMWERLRALDEASITWNPTKQQVIEVKKLAVDSRIIFPKEVADKINELAYQVDWLEANLRHMDSDPDEINTKRMRDSRHISHEKMFELLPMMESVLNAGEK